MGSVQQPGDIYHFLCLSLGEQVAVAQVVDFDVLDVVSADQLHLAIDASRGSAALLVGGRGGSDRWNVDMLDAPTRLELRIDPCRGGSCSAAFD